MTQLPVSYDHGNHPVDGANATFPSHSAANRDSMDSGFASGFNFGSNEFDFKNMNTDFDFKNMDSLGRGNLDASATFNYEQAFMEAAISIGVQDNFQAGNSQLVLAHPSHLSIDSNTILPIQVGTACLSSPDLSSTSGVLSAPTLPEPDSDDILHNRPTKRKKVDEVNAVHILPEGLRRNRTKSAKAVAALESK